MKYFLIFIFITSLFAGNANKLRAVLLETVAKILSPNKEKVYVYIEDKRYKRLIPYFKNIKIVNRCAESELVFAKDIDSLPKQCLNKKIFVTKYSSYKKYKDRVIGAFFWQKGRPTIIFNKQVLSKFNINLPVQYKKYEE